MISGLSGINLTVTADAHMERKKESESKGGELYYFNMLKAVKTFKIVGKLGGGKGKSSRKLLLCTRFTLPFKLQLMSL